MKGFFYPLILILLIFSGGCISQDTIFSEKSFPEKVNASQDYYDQMVVADPGNATAWCIRGMYYNNAFGQYEKALESYNKSLALDNGNGLCWYAKGITLQNMKRPVEAEICFENAKKADPGLPI